MQYITCCVTLVHTSIIILKRYQDEIKSSSSENIVSIYREMLKDIFFVNNIFYDDYKSYRNSFYYKGTIITKNTIQFKKEFSKFHKTISDNTISSDELYQEWISLSNDDQIQNLVSLTNDNIVDLKKENDLEKDFYEFWKVIYKSVKEISKFSNKEYND